MKNYTQFLNEEEMNEKRQTYDYGCAMIYFNCPKITEMQSKIRPEDVHENGLETEHHTTLLYGLHSAEISDDTVMGMCTEPEYSPIRLVNVSLFENADFDVLKFDADCPTLVEVNRQLVKLPHTSSFPGYHPHATIAYLKPGTGKEYVKAFSGMTALANPTEVVYSKPTGDKVKQNVKLVENS